MGYATGYNIYDENHENLIAGSQPASLFTFGNIDPRQIKPMHLEDVLHVEDQGHLNSCAGNAVTTVLETCLLHQSGGVLRPQLSRMFAYVNGQKRNNIVGDNGAVLEGCVKGAQEDGVPIEELAQYTGQYYTEFSDAARQDAKTRTLKAYCPIRQLQEAYEGIARRVGAIFLGIPCTEEIFNSGPDGKLEYYNPVKCGGHAICIVDVCDEKDENGYPYLLSPGSWNTRYGWKGYRKFRPSAFMSMLNCQYTSCYLLSEMQFLKPRYDWESQKWAA